MQKYIVTVRESVIREYQVQAESAIQAESKYKLNQGTLVQGSDRYEDEPKQKPEVLLVTKVNSKNSPESLKEQALQALQDLKDDSESIFGAVLRYAAGMPDQEIHTKYGFPFSKGK